MTDRKTYFDEKLDDRKINSRKDKQTEIQTDRVFYKILWLFLYPQRIPLTRAEAYKASFFLPAAENNRLRKIDASLYVSVRFTGIHCIYNFINSDKLINTNTKTNSFAHCIQ